MGGQLPGSLRGSGCGPQAGSLVLLQILVQTLKVAMLTLFGQLEMVHFDVPMNGGQIAEFFLALSALEGLKIGAGGDDERFQVGRIFLPPLWRLRARQILQWLVHDLFLLGCPFLPVGD